MKIDLDWIKKELDAGREVKLEGISGCYINKDNRVLSVEGDGMVVSFGVGKLWISSDNFKHFRIKRPTPTFDDLIDVLIKARKDNIVSRVEINGNSLNATVNITDSKMAEFCISKDAGDIVFKERIDWINSLYTETFVIESEEDLKGLFTVDENMTITTVNGSVFRFGDFGNLIVLGTSALFKLIKGATVIRKRGGL